MENIYCVYVHTNKANQKRYVGMTKNVRIRWKNNGDGYRNQPRFYSDIVKYGWDNFNHDIVYSGLTKEEAHKKEIELIDLLKTQNEQYGYNKNSSHNVLGTYWYTPKEKEKIIHCIELDLVFKTSLAAAEATGIDASSILKACKGIRKSAGKHPKTGERLHWEFINLKGDER